MVTDRYLEQASYSHFLVRNCNLAMSYFIVYAGFSIYYAL